MTSPLPIEAIVRAPSTGTGGEVTEEGRAFLQHRVATFSLMVGALGGLFVVLRLVVLALYPEELERELPSLLPHMAAVAFLVGAWLSCRAGDRSARFIQTAESIGLVGACVCYAIMGGFMPAVERPDMTVLCALFMTLVTRAIYVPSTARRSAVLASSIGAGYLAMVYVSAGRITAEELAPMAAYHPQATVAGYRVLSTLFASAWWAGTIAVTTAASRVIYGLRREVSHIRRLGQYTLGEQLGAGGMGVVYRASHAMLQRPTAVKLLPPERVGEDSLRRFEREVQLTAQLSHPHTITIFDYGRTPEGVFYYAMELLEGADLHEVIEAAGPMPASRVIHVLTQICGALSEAHGVGLIHRDIKPHNIMLCDRGGTADFVKVLDFGLVKHTQSPEGAALTQANVIAGTPQFMAPEALRSPDEVDARSDLYAVGVVGYYLATATLPFDGESAAVIVGHQLHTQPEPPSARRPEVPADLEAVLLQCLAKDPAQRPASAAELRTRLRQCACADDWTEEDARRWWDHYEPQLVAGRAETVVADGPTELASV